MAPKSTVTNTNNKITSTVTPKLTPKVTKTAAKKKVTIKAKLLSLRESVLLYEAVSLIIFFNVSNRYNVLTYPGVVPQSR
jgi:hypothetical protein